MGPESRLGLPRLVWWRKSSGLWVRQLRAWISEQAR